MDVGRQMDVRYRKESEILSKYNKKEVPVENVMEEEDFSKAFAASLNGLQEGEIVKGQVIKITPEFVIVDVGYKSEGQIPIHEFIDDQGNLMVKVGDKLDVLLERWEDEDGMVILSKEKADQAKIWVDVNQAYEKDGYIEGVIKSRVKGGFSVDIGLQAFLPGSQVDIHPVRNLDRMIGKTYKFKVLKYNRKRGNIVLSRRAILEKEREVLRRDTLGKLEVGQIVEGVVKNITDYGVFIDLGGIDGLLHITDISWGRVNDPGDVFKLGEKVKVKVLSFDRQSERVSLGFKQLKPDPWDSVKDKYPINSKVRGKVISLTNYGAFMEIDEGVEGLIHISEMSWTKKIKHPSQMLSMGDAVEAQVLDVDTDRRRISLGLKHLEPNPWTILEEKYPVGTVIEGRVKNLTDFGLFIGVEDGIDGLVHISDISWTQRVKHPAEVFKKGDLVKAIVLNIDKEQEKFSLGIKQLEPDPWEGITKRYKKGQVVTGTVTSVTNFGIFLELEKGIEGLIHISEIELKKGEEISGIAKVGDQLSALITNIDKKERKVGLSIKECKKHLEKAEVEEYLAQQETPISTLGDIIKSDQKNSEKEFKPVSHENEIASQTSEVSDREGGKEI
jgi:small subunit ribosomal protein S1